MNEPLELIVRQGTLVRPDGLERGDLGVAQGRLVQVGGTVTGTTAREIDATGLYVLPGIVDAHVHFNEPGRADWEGLATGSAALAAGGGTAFFDMPLNSEPPVLDAARLFEKRDLAAAKSCVDFGLWGGLTPGNLDQLAGLRDAGAIGLKAFMSESGIDSFPRIDRRSLQQGMKRAAELGLVVAVHAEDNALAARHTAEQLAAGHRTPRGWLDSRPVEVELAAITEATELAGETGCALHIVHVSSPEGVALVAKARSRGVNVTAETCPHYLLLNNDDVERIGAAAKCAPPIRDEVRRRALWSEVRLGRIHTLGSDHSPAPLALKQSPDFFAIWGGIAGCQHGFQLLLSAVADTPERDLPVLAAAWSQHVAQRFGLAHRKGRIAPGLDADFVLLEFAEPRPIVAGELLTRHPISAYIGWPNRVRIRETFVRGRTAYSADPSSRAASRGEFLRPSR